MLVQAIALPISMQSDRLVLSHVSTPSELARYNLGAQLFLPVWQVITASGTALWPVFAGKGAGTTRGELSAADHGRVRRSRSGGLPHHLARLPVAGADRLRW